MFQLFKQRKANDLITDTFNFFREQGKNYYATYLKAFGWLLLLLVLFGYLIGSAFTETLMLGPLAPQSSNMIENYFNNNFGYFLGIGVISFVVLLLMMMANYAYSVFYTQILAETGQQAQPRQILSMLKSNIGRLLLYGILFLLVMFPVFAVIGIVGLLPAITIIGIPVTISVFVFLYSWAALSFYDYLTNRSGFFTAMGRGWTLFFANPWGHLGSTVVMLIIMYTIQGLIGMISSVFGIGFSLVDGTDSLDPAAVWIMLVFFILSTVLGFILGHLVMINQGLIYYSGREMHENHGQKTEIDLIGRDFE